jgi:hypothetical protein
MDDATRQSRGSTKSRSTHDTWLAGLTLMLTERNLTPDEHARELAAITAIAADRAERMRVLWLSRADWTRRL